MVFEKRPVLKSAGLLFLCEAPTPNAVSCDSITGSEYVGLESDEASFPPLSMTATGSIVGDPLVHDDDFRKVATPLKPHCNALRLWLRIESPCVDQSMWVLDCLELAADPDYATIGKTVCNSIFSADLKVDACIDALDARRTPPRHQLLRTRPRLE